MFNQKTFTADHVRLTSIEVFSLQRRVPLIGQTCASRKFMVFIKPGKKFGGHSWFLCFANLVWCIWWTATKLYLGSKKLCSTCSGSICPVWQTFTLVESKESSPVDKENKNGCQCQNFICFGGNWSVCWHVKLWEAQPCLLDTERYSS